MNDNVQINVNPEILVWARETLTITKNQASERTGISAKRLAQLEAGEKKPTIKELKSFAKTYKRTIATLLLDEPPKEKPIPSDRRTVDSKELGNFHEKTIMAVRKARALAQSFTELWEDTGKQFPKFSIAASIWDNPNMVAKEIRRFLEIDEIREIENDNYALEGYIEKVESLGVVVFQLSLTQDNLRGFSITDDVIPIICIKRGGEKAHTKTFTLFHELGHIILREGGLCDLASNTKVEVEKWCNAFAAEALVPIEDLLRNELVITYQQLGEKKWQKKDLIELANHFHVGLLVILRRLLDQQLTTEAFYKEKHEQWNKPQFGRAKNPEGRNIPKETIKEKGRTFVSLAFQAFDQNRIDLKDLSDFLGIKLSYIPQTRQLLKI